MIITNQGRISYSEVMFNKIYHLAWGTLANGQVWTGAPVIDINSLQLWNEVGRVEYQVKEFVVRDPNGAIATDGGKWTISATPTQYMYLKFKFDKTHNPSDTIYQLGVFTDTVKAGGVSSTKTYLLPSEILTKGKMIAVHNLSASKIRDSITSELYELVLTF